MKREQTHNENIDVYIKWMKSRFPMNGAEELWIRQALNSYAKDEVIRADLNNSITKPKTKTKTLEERKRKLSIDLDKYADNEGGEYEVSMLYEFFDYWTEHNEGGKKMRFEMSKNQPFNIKRRLATWKKNQKTYNNGTTTTTNKPNRNATEDDISNYINS